MSDSIKRYELQKIINELEKYKGRGTELISLYIKPGSNIGPIVDWLEKEKNQASNIKDSTTRKNVLSALDRIIQFFKGMYKAPETGIVVFCGNISDKPGISEIELFYVIPPEPIPFFKYHCDERFWLEPLKEMIKPKNVYGIVMLDNESAIIGFLKGSNFQVVKTIEGYYHGKHRAGGQSARRFERLIELQSHEFKKKVAEACKEVFYNAENLKGIVIAGPGPTKEEFYSKDYLPNDLKQKVIAVVDIGYVDPISIKEIVAKVGDKMQDVDFVKERITFDKFYYHVVKNTGYACYGIEEVKRALESSAVDKLLISEKFMKEYPEETEELMKLAKETGADVVFFSENTEAGVQFQNVFGGLGAILRFPIY